MNLSRIVWYLQDAGHGTEGVDLFCYSMPSSVSTGILIIQQMPSEIEPYIHELRRGSFQAIIRAINVEEARVRAGAIAETLYIKGVRMGDMVFRHITPRHEPLIYPMPESRLVEASVNFDFTYILIS